MDMTDGAPGGSWGLPLLAFKSTRDHGAWGRERGRGGELVLRAHRPAGFTVVRDMKMFENGRENFLIIPATAFFDREREWEQKKAGWENENDIKGYRERNISIGKISITIGNR